MPSPHGLGAAYRILYHMIIQSLAGTLFKSAGRPSGIRTRTIRVKSPVLANSTIGRDSSARPLGTDAKTHTCRCYLVETENFEISTSALQMRRSSSELYPHGSGCCLP